MKEVPSTYHQCLKFTYNISESPLSPQSCSKSKPLQIQQPCINTQNTTCINSNSGGGLHEEHFHENIYVCIEKIKEE